MKRRRKKGIDQDRFLEKPNPLVYAAMVLIYVLARRFGELEELNRLNVMEAYRKYSRLSVILQDLEERIMIFIQFYTRKVWSYLDRDSADSLDYLADMTDAEIGYMVCKKIFGNPDRSQVWRSGVSNIEVLLDGYRQGDYPMLFLMEEASEVPYRYAMQGTVCLVKCLIPDDASLMNILGEFVGRSIEAKFAHSSHIYARVPEQLSLVICMLWEGFLSKRAGRPGSHPDYGFSDKLAKWYCGRIVRLIPRHHLFGSENNEELDAYCKSIVRSGQLEKVVHMPVATIGSYYDEEWHYARYQLDALYLDLSAKGFSGVQMADISGELFTEKVEGQREVTLKPEPVKQLLFSDEGRHDEKFKDVTCICRDIEDFSGSHDSLAYSLVLDAKQYIETKDYLSGGCRSDVLEDDAYDRVIPADIAEFLHRLGNGKVFSEDSGRKEHLE